MGRAGKPALGTGQQGHSSPGLTAPSSGVLSKLEAPRGFPAPRLPRTWDVPRRLPPKTEGRRPPHQVCPENVPAQQSNQINHPLWMRRHRRDRAPPAPHSAQLERECFLEPPGKQDSGRAGQAPASGRTAETGVLQLGVSVARAQQRGDKPRGGRWGPSVHRVGAVCTWF